MIYFLLEINRYHRSSYKEQNKEIRLNKYKKYQSKIALARAPNPVPTAIAPPKIIPAGGHITVATPEVAAIPDRKPIPLAPPIVPPIANDFPILVLINYFIFKRIVFNIYI